MPRAPYITGPFSAHLFETPLADYRPAEREVPTYMERFDFHMDMGEFPHLRGHAQPRLRVDMSPGNIYDVLAVGRGVEDQVFAVAVRVVAAEEPRPFYATGLTLEELKLLALDYLDLRPEQARGTKVRVRPLLAGEAGSAFQKMAGFDIPDGEKRCYRLAVGINGVVDPDPEWKGAMHDATLARAPA